MKKFYIKTLLFILPVILLATVIEISLRYQIPNEFAYKRQYMDANSNKVEMLILGSSHTYYGIDPAYFSHETFNAAASSQSLFYDFEIIKKYQHRIEHLQTVILPVSYFSLFNDYALNKNKSQYAVYWGIKVPQASLIDNIAVLNIQSVYRELKKILFAALNIDIDFPCTEFGWGKAYNSKDSKDLVTTGKTSAERHKAEDFTFITKNIKILRSIVEFCNERNIDIWLITTPCYATYRQHLDPHQLSSTVEAASLMAKEYDHCRYINLLDSDMFTDTDFYDADHLNEIGARKLSMLLKEMIKP
ncbi:MAG: hypothetical protein LBR10_12835 [Prevotellaceae bacterium]|jgi:hypothetical protein|nr:hypothetical protein [Prevotellaceae bacterium]